MHRNGNIYEYIAIYVDDLAIVSKNSQQVVDTLIKNYLFKLKGVSPILFHLGCDFGCDLDGTLWFGPKIYIQWMIESYEQLFGEKPKKYTSPLEKNDHPEIDISPELDEDSTKRCQSMIGAC